MKAVILQEPGTFTSITVDTTREPGPGEVLVKVRKIGVCGTDLHAFRGRQPFFSYPRIVGHELGVEVMKKGDQVQGLEPGTYCALEPYLYCGKCSACRRGKTNCCENLQVMGVHVDGGMQEFLTVDAKHLYPSDKLQPEQLALVETLGIGAHAVERAQIDDHDSILVIGAGPIGLSVLQFARAHPVPLTMADINTSRLAFCQQQMGVKHTLDAADPDFVKNLKTALDGDLPTVIFDATGNPKSMQGAINFLAPGGKLLLVGLYQGDFTFHDPLFHKKEVTLMSSRNATGSNFSNIIQMMEDGVINTTPWITHHLTMEEVPTNFHHLFDPQAALIKAMVSV
jgi:2-desacetyl-2-hydroxyethyl bacteriochlorophyllide A dehydrogenase